MPRSPLVAGALCLLGCASQQPPSPPASPHTVCAEGDTVEGIDVSEHQGVVDWAAVRAAGKRFAFARVMHAPKLDPTFARNWAAMREAGLYRGAYVYFVPSADVEMQADALIAAVGRLGPGDLAPVLDVEQPPPNIPSREEYVARIARWVTRVTEGTGRAPMIYTGRNYWNARVASASFETLPLWHAQYTQSPCPTIADAWSTWRFWQYACTGRILGVEGDVDLDRFRGSLDDLAHLAGMPDIDAGLAPP